MIKRMHSIMLLATMGIVSPIIPSCCPSSCSKDNSNLVATRFAPRSQGRDRVIQMVGSIGHTDIPDIDTWYLTGAITPEYTQSFRSTDIAQCLFGPFLVDTDSCKARSIRVQGSNVLNRDNNRAWLADYFYLPSDYDSILNFTPRIRNVLVNLDLYAGFDCWVEGLYVHIYGPITHTRWNLSFCETINNSGELNYAAGTFTPDVVPRTALLANFTEYAAGLTPGDVQGVTFQGLNAARISTCDDTKTGFADLYFDFGWNFWQCNDFHLGAYIQFVAPTGSKSKSCYFFDAHIGENKAELGVGINGHYIFWRNEIDECEFGFYLDASVTHVFSRSEHRFFDLKDKPFSRYMLAQKLGPNMDALQNSIGIPSDVQFAGEFAPIANLTQQDVKVSIGAQTDIVALFNFSWCQWSWDFGYNFWGRSCEKISVDCDCPLFADNIWALKGNAQVFGFASASSTNPPILIDDAVPVAATQSLATIVNGVTPNSTTVGSVTTINTGADNNQRAFAGDGPDPLTSAPGVIVDDNPINTSIQPIFISANDIDYGARTRGISHKVFTHLSYNFDCDCWAPYLGIGGFAEFGKDENRCHQSSPNIVSRSCTDCIDCALSQWAVWIKAGITY